MAALVQHLGWPMQSAAFALAALEARGTRGATRGIDAGELRRLARVALESGASQRLVQRARAILRAYERAVTLRGAIERIDPEHLSPADMKTLRSQWGPGPWTDEEERPERPCLCGERWPFCPDCGMFVQPQAKHICNANPIAIVLDHPHRHCVVCNVPAPEPCAPQWSVQVPVGDDIITVTVTGSWLVAPVARVDPVSTRREVFGWACSAHRSEAWERVPPADDAIRVTLSQGSTDRVATRRKRLRLDESKVRPPVFDGDPPRSAAMDDILLDDAIDLAWAGARRRRVEGAGGKRRSPP